jgi:hypothetical protein
MGLMTGLLVNLNRGVIENHTLLLHLGITPKKIDSTGPERLHFGSQKGNPGLKSLKDEIIP